MYVLVLYSVGKSGIWVKWSCDWNTVARPTQILEWCGHSAQLDAAIHVQGCNGVMPVMGWRIACTCTVSPEYDA